MMKKLISTPIILIAIIFIIPIAVYSADRLVVKNDSDAVTFKVKPNGQVFASGLAIGASSPTHPVQLVTTGTDATVFCQRTDGRTTVQISARSGKTMFGARSNHKLNLTVT